MSDTDDPFPGKPLGNGLYEVNLDEMGDVEIFQARAPGFQLEDGVPFPHEPVNADTPLSLLDIVSSMMNRLYS